MWTQVYPEYRNGLIAFCGHWFEGTEVYRRSSIRHEITAHFILEPIAQFAKSLIAKFKDEKAFHQHLAEQHRVQLETAACDIEEALSIAIAIGRADAFRSPDYPGPGGS